MRHFFFLWNFFSTNVSFFNIVFAMVKPTVTVLTPYERVRKSIVVELWVICCLSKLSQFHVLYLGTKWKRKTKRGDMILARSERGFKKVFTSRGNRWRYMREPWKKRSCWKENKATQDEEHKRGQQYQITR